MVAARNIDSGEDYGTSQYVFEQTQQRGPQRRPAIYTTLRIVIDANAGTVERHLEARDGELREQFALSNRFENPAAAISFYAALGFKINRKRSKGGRVVLEAKATYVSGTPDEALAKPAKSNWRDDEWRRRQHKQRTNAPLALKPLTRRAAVCRVVGCEQPREAGSRRCLCLAHRQQDDKRRKSEYAAKKAARGVVQS